MKQSPYQLLMGVVLLGTVAFLSWQAGGLAAAGMQYIQSENGPGEQKQAVVVIDPGHGGTDPGKVGIDGQLEKDINLAVAKKLKTYLEASDVKVVLTRDVDTGLYSNKDTHKKMADMKKRCQLIEEAKPDLVISIHQNSYHEEAIRGGQVFYYKTSVRGKKLAESLQKRFDYVLGDSNKRQAKLLSPPSCERTHCHCRVRLFIQPGRGEKAGNRGVPGPAGLDLTYGDHGISEPEPVRRG